MLDLSVTNLLRIRFVYDTNHWVPLFAEISSGASFFFTLAVCLGFNTLPVDHVSLSLDVFQYKSSAATTTTTTTTRRRMTTTMTTTTYNSYSYSILLHLQQ